MMPENINYHSILFPYAYNILGSVADAEDVVGNVLVGYLDGTAKGVIVNEKNYLIKSVINRAITTKQQQKRTLRHGESWLPEPVATDDAADRNVDLREILSYSLLVLLERLTPVERAVFILRESFEYTHEEIGEALGLKKENSRQLHSRARKKLYKPVLRVPVQSNKEKEVLERFISVIRARNTGELERLMAAEIKFEVDGGGITPFLNGACSGASLVARLHIDVFERFLYEARFVITNVNHQPAILSIVSGKLISCEIFELNAEQNLILQISALLDPNKLRLLNF